MTFNRVVSDNNIEFTPPAPEEYDVHEFFLRGEKLCRAVYTTVYEPMREKMSAVIPHLDEWMIVEGYGKTLSRNGLDTVTRELVIVATLASCGWRRQLYSHIRGAINVGSHPLAIKDALICSLYCGFDNSYNNALSVYEQVVTSLSE
ncbi:MAG: carboxymuconolactone decarboxylase family protein, partial [Candidatus Kapabacteria bacterium]|nr:carboxymuconolactone decarboxylase family protein [Candidatus Kapabacteria bacterium]